MLATPDREAYRYPDGEDWTSVTWGQTGDRVRRIAAGLIALGVEPEQRVGIASGTRYEWILADLAIMSSGAATTTVYPSSMADDVAFILGDSDSHVVFAEDVTQVAKLRAQRSALPALSKVVVFDTDAEALAVADSSGTAAAEGDDGWVITLDDLEAMGAELLGDEPDVVDRRVAETRSDHLATLIYTSGTTGRPKGVRLPHSAWTYEGACGPGSRHPDARRCPVPVAAPVALVRQGAARRPSSRSASRPRSTDAWTRSSTTSR